MNLRACLSVVPLLAAVLAGCVAVDVSTAGGRETVVVENNVCKLFGCLPIASGDPDYPNEEVCNWFENTVSLKTNLRLLDEEVRRRGAVGFKDASSYRYEEQIIPFLLKRNSLYTSAELVR